MRVNNGVLTLGSVGGIAIVDGAQDSSILVVEGVESAVNAALDTLVYTPAADYSGSDTLSVVSSIDSALLGRYDFSAGAALNTSIAGFYDGILLGGASTGTDITRAEAVLNLNGIDGTVQIASQFGAPASLSATAWVDSNNGDATVLSVGGSLSIRIDDTDTSGNTSASFWDGSAYQAIDTSQILAGTGWRHVAATYDGASKELAVYIDGEIAGREVFSNALVFASSNTYLGSFDGSARFLDGSIDDARVYDRVLSADEIAALALDSAEASGLLR